MRACACCTPWVAALVLLVDGCGREKFSCLHDLYTGPLEGRKHAGNAGRNQALPVGAVAHRLAYLGPRDLLLGALVEDDDLVARLPQAIQLRAAPVREEADEL